MKCNLIAYFCIIINENCFETFLKRLIMKKAIIICSFFLFSITLYGQWTWRSPLPQGNNMYGIYFTDSLNGWAVGGAGTILCHSQTGWEIAKSPTINTLRSVSFSNPSNGWAVGDSGTILHYNGTGWVITQTNDTFTLYSVYCIDNKHVWIVGRMNRNPYNDLVLKFNGVSWVQENFGYHPYPNSICFTDSINGWIAGEDGIYKHEQTGWVLDTIISGCKSISFPDPKHGWVATTYGIYKYTDTGWLKQVSYGSFNSISFVDSTFGWVVGNNTIFKYTGDKWQEDTEIYPVHFNSVFFTDRNNGWVAGNYGQILKRTGNQWLYETPVKKIPYAEQISFTDKDYGWFAGYLGLLNYNQGNWLEYPINLYVRDVFILSRNLGWAVGDSGIILKFDGNSWTKYPSHTTNPLYAVHFTDANHGWAVGYQIALKYDGTGWYPQNLGFVDSYRDVWFTDADHGWIVGSQKIYSYDSSVWKSFTASGMKSVCFIDKNHGWVLGNMGLYYKYCFGNWTSGIIGENIDYINSVYFTDTLNGWAAGSNGTIFHYDGTNWKPQQSFCDQTLSAIFFIDTLHGWTAGGAILSTDNGGCLNIRIPEQEHLLPNLSNYPNPFTSLTTIRYTLPQNGSVKLLIYDSYGKIIKIAINKFQTAGNYELEFDGSGLPNGIYFYNLQTSSTSVCKKLLLLK